MICLCHICLFIIQSSYFMYFIYSTPKYPTMHTLSRSLMFWEVKFICSDMHKSLVQLTIILRHLGLSCFCCKFYILILHQMSLFHYNSYTLNGRNHKEFCCSPALSQYAAYSHRDTNMSFSFVLGCSLSHSYKNIEPKEAAISI